MSQGVLPFKYEEEKKDTGTTALGGLPVYLDLATGMGIRESIECHLHITQQGLTDKQTVMSLLLLLNLAGGDCVADLRKLIIRLVKDNPAVDLLIEAKRQIMALSWLPSG